MLCVSLVRIDSSYIQVCAVCKTRENGKSLSQLYKTYIEKKKNAVKKIVHNYVFSKNEKLRKRKYTQVYEQNDNKSDRNTSLYVIIVLIVLLFVTVSHET